jgi:uncharacterized protein YbcI
LSAHLQAVATGEMAGTGRANRRGSLNEAIADAVVRSHTRCVGRGPRRALAFYRDNVVVVVLQGTLTKGELSLAADGRHGAVMRIRRQFRELMRAELMKEIEALTGCGVLALVSDNSVEPDLVVELFVLDRSVDGGHTKTTARRQRPDKPGFSGGPNSTALSWYR